MFLCFLGLVYIILLLFSLGKSAMGDWEYIQLLTIPRKQPKLTDDGFFNSFLTIYINLIQNQKPMWVQTKVKQREEGA